MGHALAQERALGKVIQDDAGGCPMNRFARIARRVEPALVSSVHGDLRARLLRPGFCLQLCPGLPLPLHASHRKCGQAPDQHALNAQAFLAEFAPVNLPLPTVVHLDEFDNPLIGPP